MSIVRVGLSENEKFAQGYEAIFGKKEDKTTEPKSTEEQAKKDEKPVEKKK